ncbi:COG0325 Predicted enzyme with a TIM-barrel fold [Candidatus Pelagibacterales bacterium]|jgi:pyridoxal phosphate enzyme (YggS family)
MDILKNYNQVLNNINNISKDAILIVVSKTFLIPHIKPIIDFGHIHFGENRVQESITKWSDLLKVSQSLKLHLIGKLQTNKVVEAINHFSVIHSLDSEKLALKISQEEKNFNKKLDYFIQINIGQENQKSGISIEDSSKFINFCKNELKINVIGLMCLPPIAEDPKKYFLDLKKIANNNQLFNLSMGMSNDYLEALKCGSNYLRIGSAILGDRTNY